MSVFSASVFTGFGVGLVQAQVFSAIVSPAVHILSREWDYAQNYDTPNVVPGPSEALDAYYKGIIVDRTDLNEILKLNGVSISLNGKQFDGREDYWESILQAGRPTFDPQFARLLWRMGRMGTNPDLTDTDNLLFHLTRRGLADPKMLDQFLNYTEPLSTGDYLQGWLRGYISDNLLKLRLNANNLNNPIEIDLATKLTQAFPTIDLLTNFATYSSYDDGLALRYGFDLEKPLWYNTLAKTAGWGDSAYPTIFPGAGRPGFYWSDMLWRQHWIYPSVSQWFDMRRRITNDNIEAVQQQFPAAFVPQQSDIDLAFRQQNVPPALRDNLAVLQYNVLGIRQIQRLIQTEVIGEKEASAILQRSGYTKADSDLEARALFKLQAQKQLARIRVDSKNTVETAYQEGTIDKDTASILLYRLEITDPDSLATFDGMIRPQQLVLANNDPKVQAQLGMLSAKETTAYVRSWVKLLHKAVADGALTVAQAGLTLQSIGLQEWKVSRYMSLWSGEILYRHKDISAGKIVRYVELGILLPSEATVRLQNLGYNPAAITGMLAEAQIAITSKQLREQQQELKTKEQQIKAAQAAAKAAAKEKRAAELLLLKLGTVAQLKKWLACGVITEQEMKDRLTFDGYQQVDIDRVIADAKEVKCKGA